MTNSSEKKDHVYIQTFYGGTQSFRRKTFFVTYVKYKISVLQKVIHEIFKTHVKKLIYFTTNFMCECRMFGYTLGSFLTLKNAFKIMGHMSQNTMSDRLAIRRIYFLQFSLQSGRLAIRQT
jgi:hypothetical protein